MATAFRTMLIVRTHSTTNNSCNERIRRQHVITWYHALRWGCYAPLFVAELRHGNDLDWFVSVAPDKFRVQTGNFLYLNLSVNVLCLNGFGKRSCASQTFAMLNCMNDVWQSIASLGWGDFNKKTFMGESTSALSGLVYRSEHKFQLFDEQQVWPPLFGIRNNAVDEVVANLRWSIGFVFRVFACDRLPFAAEQISLQETKSVWITTSQNDEIILKTQMA